LTEADITSNATHATQRTQRNALACVLTQLTLATQEKYANQYATNATDSSDTTAKMQGQKQRLFLRLLRALRWVETKLKRDVCGQGAS